MAITTDRLHTVVTLDAGNYAANASRVVAATAKMKAAGVGDGRQLAGLGSLAATLSGPLMAGLTVVGAGLTVAAGAVGALGAASVTAYANLERLSLGLQAVEGSADIAADRMKELRELAKAPGLGFAEAVGAFGQLRNAGASSAFSQSIIKEIANANARGGGDSATFARLLQAVSQSLNSPFLQGDEMRQFRENRLPVDAALKARFGTSDTEELNKRGVTSEQAIRAIVEEFSKMERVSGGLSNSMENLQDTVNQALASIGQGLAPGIMSILGDVSNAFGELTDSGVLDLFGRNLARIGNEVSAAFTNAGGGKGLAELTIDLGAALIDVSTVIGNVTTGIVSILRFLPGVSSLLPVTGMLSGGAGEAFRVEALAELERFRNQPSAKPIAEQAAEELTKNPVQQRQLAAQERIAVATERLVRYEEMALGGGDMLRRGLGMAQMRGFGSRGPSPTSNPTAALAGAIDALIAQRLGRMQN